ncbi:hypothetical protein F5Y18DRAFT_444249 [Xylariaceae sp. FL1019]|nr:hypothetical protein F5Y18DRAFT_444249 [Xylariaceae sp. FL1019]
MADLDHSIVPEGPSTGTLNGQQQVQSVIPLICYICPETPKFDKKSALFKHLLGIRHKTMAKKGEIAGPEPETPFGRFLGWWEKYNIDQELRDYSDHCCAKEMLATAAPEPTKTIPQVCYLCSETTEFSHQQQLIAHLLSESHCKKFRESLRGNFDNWDALKKFLTWYNEHNIDLLMKPHIEDNTRAQRAQIVDMLFGNHRQLQSAGNDLRDTQQAVVPENKSEENSLACPICPETHDFFLQAQMIDHLGSESHLSRMARLNATRGTNKPDYRLRQYDEWFFKHKIGEKLLAAGKIKYALRNEDGKPTQIGKILFSGTSKPTLRGGNPDAMDDGLHPSPASAPTRSSFDAGEEAMATQDWNATPRSFLEKATPEETEAFKMAYTDAITNWVQNTHVVQANLAELQDRKDCDIEPETGRLLEPVLYPRTLRAQVDDLDKGNASMAATERIRAFFAQHPERFLGLRDSRSQQSRDKRTREEIQKEAQRRAAQDAEDDARYEREAAARRPQIACHFRPAESRDVNAITDLYNKEVAGQSTVMELDPLPTAHMQNLLKICTASSLPFAVAVEGDSASLDNKQEKVIGFAMVIQGTRGFTGLNNVMGKVGGKLLVVVDEAFRKKKIGTALINLMLTSCSGLCPERREGYKFINPKKIKGLGQGDGTDLKFFYIDMEVILESGNTEQESRQSERYKWISDLLEDKFCMLLTKYEYKALFNGRHYLDKVTFRHFARLPY